MQRNLKIKTVILDLYVYSVDGVVSPYKLKLIFLFLCVYTFIETRNEEGGGGGGRLFLGDFDH